jgi:3-oxoacyl-[acyl-carrier protein] reductase
MIKSLPVQQLILTGGSGGLGKAIIEEFTDPAWQVTSPSRLEMDVRDLDVIQKWMEGRSVDLLICSAGIIQDQLLLNMEDTTWDDLIRVNYQGAAACAHHVIPNMILSKQGHIIFISSYSSLHPGQGQSAYATAKAGLIGLTSALSQRYGKYNIRVNAIFPGYMETPMSRDVALKEKAKILGKHALGRFNDVKNCARFCRFLHESMPDTSGQVFQLDSRPMF